MSLIVGKKTLYLYNLNDPDNPIELAFQVMMFICSFYNNKYHATFCFTTDVYLYQAFSQMSDSRHPVNGHFLKKIVLLF